jgi:hypothetical protein
VPVFDALVDRDVSGRTWLARLLQLASGASGRVDARTTGSLAPGHPRWWGKNERHLAPPIALLKWLVEHVEAPAKERIWGSGATRANRERLVARDPTTTATALRLLDGDRVGRAWYVLEGESQPDAVLETEALLIVIEGKRTEREATTITTWMRRRNQMLRHMDAAWEVRREREVRGLMIVEGPGGADAVDPSAYWLSQAAILADPEIQEASLPHRTVTMRERIGRGFLGVTTWQAVCAEFGLPWPPDKS